MFGGVFGQFLLLLLLLLQELLRQGWIALSVGAHGQVQRRGRDRAVAVRDHAGSSVLRLGFEHGQVEGSSEAVLVVRGGWHGFPRLLFGRSTASLGPLLLLLFFGFFDQAGTAPQNVALGAGGFGQVVNATRFRLAAHSGEIETDAGRGAENAHRGLVFQNGGRGFPTPAPTSASTLRVVVGRRGVVVQFVQAELGLLSQALETVFGGVVGSPPFGNGRVQLDVVVRSQQPQHVVLEARVRRQRCGAAGRRRGDGRRHELVELAAARSTGGLVCLGRCWGTAWERRVAAAGAAVLTALLGHHVGHELFEFSAFGHDGFLLVGGKEILGRRSPGRVHRGLHHLWRQEKIAVNATGAIQHPIAGSFRGCRLAFRFRLGGLVVGPPVVGAWPMPVVVAATNIEFRNLGDMPWRGGGIAAVGEVARDSRGPWSSIRWSYHCWIN